MKNPASLVSEKNNDFFNHSSCVLLFCCFVAKPRFEREIIWHKEKQCASNDPSRRGWWMQAIYVVDGKWHKSLKLNIAAAAAAAAALPGEQLSW